MSQPVNNDMLTHNAILLKAYVFILIQLNIFFFKIKRKDF